MKNLIFILSFIFSSFTFSQKIQLGFTENKGQINSEKGELREDVIATFHSTKGLFVIRKNGYSFIEYQLEKSNFMEQNSQHAKNEYHEEKNENTKVSLNKIDVNWNECNSNPIIVLNKKTNIIKNFYNTKTDSPVLNVSTFEEIRLKNIYNGIDVRFYFKDGNLEYDYILSTSQSLKKLNIEVQGGKYSLLSNGDLCIQTEFGKIKESAPKVFQNKKEIPSFWRLYGENKATFRIKSSSKNSEIIIDPIIREWATYLGSSNSNSFSNDISCDSEGNVYAVGTTNSIENMVPEAFGNITYIGSQNDAFISKYD
jgi:hypothetical protein